MNPAFLCFTTILKGVTIAVTLLMLVLLVNNSFWLYQRLEKYGSYNSLKEYYGISISPYIDASEEGLQKLDDALVLFYKKTDGKDSILLNVETQVLLYDGGFIDKDELDIKDYAISINETYLREHPIYDVKGKAVKITGNKKENYLVVPVKYQGMEAEIKEYYEENNTFLRYYIDDLKKIGIEAANNQKHITIPTHIIYIADGQTCKVYNMYIGGKLNCILKDPLISVITTENVSIAQIPGYVTNQDYLIKVDRSSKLRDMEKAIKETGLDRYLLNFSPVINQYYSDLKINAVHVLLQFIIIIALHCLTFIFEMRFFQGLSLWKLIICIAISWLLSFFLLPFFQLSFRPMVFMGIGAMVIMDLFVFRKYSKLNLGLLLRRLR